MKLLCNNLSQEFCYWRNFVKIAIFLVVILGSISIFSNQIKAEGTKTASPSPNSCTALSLLPSRQNGDYLNCGESNRIYFRITDYQTEKLFYGFDWQEYGGGTLKNMYIKIFAPDGSLAAGPLQLPSSGAGFIDSYTKAVTGPIIGQTNLSGYLPLIFNPKSNGEYWIELYRSLTKGKTQTLNKVWSYSPYFDLTIATDAGEVHNGRVHCGKWGFIAIQPQTFANDPLASGSPVLYPITDDGVVYKISFQDGFEPIDFTVAMTWYGIVNTGNWLKDRISRNDVVSPSLNGGYPIFLNPPDPKVYKYATLPPKPTFANPGIIGCYPGPYTIRFYLSQSGDCRLLLDMNGVSGYQANTTDQMIDIPNCKQGLNTYVWDGKDGFGNVVSASTEIGVSLIYNSGRGNLPIYDAEINKGGFNIACIAPINIDHIKIYWDDSHLTKIGISLKNNLNNLTGAGLYNSVIGSITPAHAWNGDGNFSQTIPAPAVNKNDEDYFQANDFGNVRTINSWFWGVELSSFSMTKITCVSIEGTVWDKSFGKVDPIGTNAGGLNVILVDPATYTIFASAPVNADGTYELAHCPINGANMPLILSTTPGIEGMKAPVASLPAQWTYWNSNTFTVSTQTKSLSHVDFNIMLISKSSYIEGFVKDKKTLNVWANATIFLYNKLDQKVYIAKTDKQGYFKIKIRIPFDGVIKAIDKSTISDCLILSAVHFQQDSIQKISRDLLLEKLFIGKVLKINNIHYNFDKWNIRTDARPILDSIVTLMKTYPIKIELSSHTDSRGSDAYNDRLSQRRAEAATNYIVQNGIDPSRIVAKGYGKRHLLFISKNGIPCTEAENAANRRTEFKVIGVISIENQENTIDPNLFRNGEQLDRNALPADFFEPCQ